MKMPTQREKAAKCFAEGGMADKKQDVKMVKSGVGQHESNMHKGKPKTPIKLAAGGVGKLRKGMTSASGKPLSAPRGKMGRGY